MLLELLESTNLKYQSDASVALCKLSSKASTLSPVDAAPPSPIPQVVHVVLTYLVGILIHLSEVFTYYRLFQVVGRYNLCFCSAISSIFSCIFFKSLNSPLIPKKLLLEHILEICLF